jgi:hypothetical protein
MFKDEDPTVANLAEKSVVNRNCPNLTNSTTTQVIHTWSIIRLVTCKVRVQKLWH